MKMDALNRTERRLVVVPSDPIAAYERAGHDWLDRYYNPGGFFQEVFALSPLEEGERQAHGITILGVPEHRFGHLLRDLRPDVVRGYGGYWAADLVCRHRVPNVPVVVSVHDTNPSMLHRSVHYADMVLCMSKAVAERVIAIGTDPARTRIVPNRVDTSIFHPVTDQAALRSVACRFPAGRHILHVGRKSKQKNLDILICALKFLPADYSCVFIGLGDCTAYVSLAEQMGVSTRCFWVASVKNSELPLWYSWCDCMCTPSRWEGFGIVFIEAAACGAAVVTSDIAPMNEYLTHDMSAYLVKEYENPQAVAEGILKACEAPEYRRVISAGAIETAKSFDRCVVDAMEVDIYREAMSLKPPSLPRRMELAVWKGQQTAAPLVRAMILKAKHIGNTIRRHVRRISR